jgi:hypothetical protein
MVLATPVILSCRAGDCVPNTGHAEIILLDLPPVVGASSAVGGQGGAPRFAAGEGGAGGAPAVTGDQGGAGGDSQSAGGQGGVAGEAGTAGANEAGAAGSDEGGAAGAMQSAGGQGGMPAGPTSSGGAAGAPAFPGVPISPRTVIGQEPTSCGAAAVGCVPGQSCPAACDCVIARASGSSRTGLPAASQPKIVDRCILASVAGPPAVEIWSHDQILCE